MGDPTLLRSKRAISRTAYCVNWLSYLNSDGTEDVTSWFIGLFIWVFKWPQILFIQRNWWCEELCVYYRNINKFGLVPRQFRIANIARRAATTFKNRSSHRPFHLTLVWNNIRVSGRTRYDIRLVYFVVLDPLNTKVSSRSAFLAISESELFDRWNITR